MDIQGDRWWRTQSDANMSPIYFPDKGRFTGNFAQNYLFDEFSPDL
jgi:hypothetical protein